MNKSKFRFLKMISADFLLILKKIIVDNIKRLFGFNSLYRQINKLLSPNFRIRKSFKAFINIISESPERVLSWKIIDVKRDCRFLNIDMIADGLI
jgi:hypothetical protein